MIPFYIFTLLILMIHIDFRSPLFGGLIKHSFKYHNFIISSLYFKPYEYMNIPIGHRLLLFRIPKMICWNVYILIRLKYWDIMKF